jgi:hypothetical protein
MSAADQNLPGNLGRKPKFPQIRALVGKREYDDESESVFVLLWLLPAFTNSSIMFIIFQQIVTKILALFANHKIIERHNDGNEKEAWTEALTTFVTVIAPQYSTYNLNNERSW